MKAIDHRTELRQRLARAAVVTASVFAAAGCVSVGGGNPKAGSETVKTGELGNGAFSFRCDDSVACEQYNTYWLTPSEATSLGSTTGSNAARFPSAVAQGSNFEFGFYLADKSSTRLKTAEPGTTIETVGKYITRGPEGFAGIEAGYTTITARDSKGWVIDYAVVRVSKPESLTIYDGEYAGKEKPVTITELRMDLDGRKTLRTVAQDKGLQPLAGTFNMEWTSSAPSVVKIDGYIKGKVTLVAAGVGKATLTAKGAGLTQNVEVEVVEKGSTPTDGGSEDSSVPEKDGG
jgi:hypothetical protein